jgi:hypothetical protein
MSNQKALARKSTLTNTETPENQFEGRGFAVQKKSDIQTQKTDFNTQLKQAKSFGHSITKLAGQESSGASPVQRSDETETAAQQIGNITEFSTDTMSTGAAATLHHQVMWNSSTGNLEDLAHIETREEISWEAAPQEFGPDQTYSTAGTHNGHGTSQAEAGQGTDDHSIIPTGFSYALDAAGSSAVWKMQQNYQYKANGGEWRNIQGASYEITRWFEREGSDLVAYVAKRGISEAKGHRAMVKVPNYFNI